LNGKPIEKPKVFQRMMESVEGLRKKLTSNTEADLYIEAIMNEEDLEKTFTRDEYNKVI
jgi:molecular chaperone DnaK (HSP70)